MTEMIGIIMKLFLVKFMLLCGNSFYYYSMCFGKEKVVAAFFNVFLDFEYKQMELRVQGRTNCNDFFFLSTHIPTYLIRLTYIRNISNQAVRYQFGNCTLT